MSNRTRARSPGGADTETGSDAPSPSASPVVTLANSHLNELIEASDALYDDRIAALDLHDSIWDGLDTAETDYRNQALSSESVLDAAMKQAKESGSEALDLARILDDREGGLEAQPLEERAALGEVRSGARELMGEVIDAGPDYRDAFAVPEAQSRIKLTGNLPKEIARVREPVATIHRIVHAMDTFRSEAGSEASDGAKLATATDGLGVRGDAAWVARAMFKAGQPVALIRAFCEASGMALSDFPLLAHEALAAEGGETATLEDAAGPLVASLIGIDESTPRWTAMPTFADLNESMVYGELAQVHNRLHEFYAARAGLEGGIDGASETFDLLLTAPAEAADLWAGLESNDALPRSVRDALGGLDEIIATARAEGRLDTMARQGFIPGETDEDTVMDILDQSAAMAVQAYDLGLASAREVDPDVEVDPSMIGALRAYLNSIDATRSGAERRDAAIKAGVVASTVDQAAFYKDFVVAGSSTVKASIECQQLAFENRMDTLRNQAFMDRPGHFEDLMKTDPDILKDPGLRDRFAGAAADLELGKNPEFANLNARATRAANLASALDGVAIVGDLIGLASGVIQVANAKTDQDTMTGWIDITGSVAGLGLTTAAMMGSAGAAAAGAPVAVMFAYVKLVHQSLGEAYKGMRTANSKLRSQQVGFMLDAMDRAATKTARAAAAANLAETDKDAASVKVFTEAVEAAAVSTLTVFSFGEDLTNPAKKDEMDPLAELVEVSAIYSGWTDAREELAGPYNATAGTAAKNLRARPEGMKGKMTSLTKNGPEIIDGAVVLAEGVAAFIRKQVKKDFGE